MSTGMRMSPPRGGAQAAAANQQLVMDEEPALPPLEPGQEEAPQRKARKRAKVWPVCLGDPGRATGCCSRPAAGPGQRQACCTAARGGMATLIRKACKPRHTTLAGAAELTVSWQLWACTRKSL